MRSATAWLISQLIISVIYRLQQAGKYNSLTQEEADAELARITAALSSDLPSPQELIDQGRRQP